MEGGQKTSLDLLSIEVTHLGHHIWLIFNIYTNLTELLSSDFSHYTSVF